MHKILVKHKVFTTSEILDVRRSERITQKGGTLLYSIITMRYTFWATDGSSVISEVVGEGMDSGDKASNKAMAIAHKYCLLQAFCTPTEEQKDPDFETQPQSEPKAIDKCLAKIAEFNDLDLYKAYLLKFRVEIEKGFKDSPVDFNKAVDAMDNKLDELGDYNG